MRIAVYEQPELLVTHATCKESEFQVQTKTNTSNPNF